MKLLAAVTVCAADSVVQGNGYEYRRRYLRNHAVHEHRQSDSKQGDAADVE
jgi:hypothetical protein